MFWLMRGSGIPIDVLSRDLKKLKGNIEIMNTVRKIFASALVLATIVSVSGINLAKAAAMDGDLIKMNGLSTVYYYKGGKRYVFPNEKTFMSWYADFNSVRVVSQSELESYPLAANVTVRGGTYLVKITTNPTVYAVEPGGKLRSIVSEANASSLWGSNWASKVIDVPDSFFTNYTITTALTAGMYPAGSLVKKASAADVYYFDGTNFRKFASESAFYANKFRFNFVQTAPEAMTMTMGTDITGNEAGLTDLSYGAGGTVGGSGLSVALSSDTPASANIPHSSTHVTYTKFNVTAANDGDVTLQTVTVTRAGVGSPSNFSSVYLYDGTTRLTSGRSINSSTNQAVFSNVNFTIAKGTTKTLSIVADMSSETSGNNMLSINLASDIVANGATVSGSFPVTGNTMSLSGVQGGQITVARNGSISDPRAGDLAAKVASFQLTAGSKEDLTVKGITLYQIGSISNGNMSNFVLKQAGTTIATTASMGSNGYMVFNFTTPFALAKGDSRNFDVYADISALARANDTIKIYLDNAADVNANGNTYGFGPSVVSTYDGSDASNSTVKASQVTFSYQGPAATDYAVQQKAVELLRFNAVSQPNIEIRKTVITLDSTGSNLLDHYTNIKLVDANTGTLLAGPKDSAGAVTTQDLTFTDTWNVNAGTTKTIKVIADIANFTPAGGEKIKATLKAFGSSDIKNLDTNQYILNTDIVPASAIAGANHSVKSGSLTVSLAGTPSAKNIINGSTSVPMVGINLSAGTGKDVTVTSIKVTITGANSCSTETNCVSSVKLMDGNNQVGTTQNITQGVTTATATFNSLAINITKGQQKTITAQVDLLRLNSIAGSTSLHIDVADGSHDVTAQDSNGNNVGASGNPTGPTMTIVASGSMTVVAAPTEPALGYTGYEEKLLVAGSNDNVIGKFKFNATNEDLKITRVRVEIPDNALTTVNSIALFDGTNNITGYQTLTGGTPNYVDFTSFTSDFIVLKDSSKTLTVKANLNTIANGAVMETLVTATLSQNGNGVGSTFEARGLNGSNTVLTDSDVTLNKIGVNNYVYKTKPTIANVALPTGLLTAGQNTVAKISISADAAGQVDWRTLVFHVAPSTKVTASSPVLKDESNNTIGSCTGGGVEGTAADIVCTTATDNVVAAGATKTYSLKMTIALGDSNPASTSTSIALTGSAIGGAHDYTYFYNGGTPLSSFIWSDEGDPANPHTTTTSDYHNDWKVGNIPTDPQTLSK